MGVINFIINNILTQAGITLALIALLGLVLQRKSIGQTIAGTFKTLLGFQVLSAGSAIIVASLIYFGKIFTQGFHMQGIIPSIEAINGQAMNELGLGSPIAFTFLAIFVVNIIIARFTKWKYVFLTGQAILWMATMCTAFGYFAGLRGFMLVAVGGVVGGIFAVAMPAMAQPIVRKITGNNDIALGHFCTIGYLFEAGVAKLVGNPEQSVEKIELPKAFEFLQDTYLSVMVIMVPLYLITAFFAGEEFCQPLAGNTNYLVHSFLQAIQFVVGVYVLLAGVRLILGEIVPYVMSFQRLVVLRCSFNLRRNRSGFSRHCHENCSRCYSSTRLSCTFPILSQCGYCGFCDDNNRYGYCHVRAAEFRFGDDLAGDAHELFCRRYRGNFRQCCWR